MIKNKVTIKNAILAVSDNMGAEDLRETPLLTIWAMEAEMKIGSYYSYRKKIAVLDVKDCRACLPCDAVSLRALVLGDLGCDCGLQFDNFFSQRPILDEPFNMAQALLVVSEGNTWCGAGIMYEIQNNCIVFTSNFDGHKVTIQYLGYETDSKGFPLINENHIDAISQYLEYKIALRGRYGPPEKRVSEQIVYDLRKEWGRKLRNARAEDGELTPPQQAEIANMINNPTSGRGMQMWVYNSPYFLNG